jgi:very-short-patch-repair endonuclease
MISNNHYNPNLKEFARELRTCSVSRAEKRIWKALLSRKQMNIRFLRQRPIDNFIVDFFAPEIGLIIEIDGNSHYRKPEYDKFRQEKLEKLGYTFLRFSEGDVMYRLDDVFIQIEHGIKCLRELR